jgi:hypothetical protein
MGEGITETRLVLSSCLVLLPCAPLFLVTPMTGFYETHKAPHSDF